MSSNGSDSLSPTTSGSPKFGTVVPNRIFVGGISANTTEAELGALFSKYGNVKATKIIIDKAGISKGYGFITFETEEEAQKVLKEVDGLVLKERKLNIASAVKKQPFAKVLGGGSQIPTNAILYQGSVAQAYGSAPMIAGREGLYLPQTAYPVVLPQPVYLPHQCHYPATGSASGYSPQYIYTAIAPSSDMYHCGSPSPVCSPSDYSETSATDTSNEGGKQYGKQNSASSSCPGGEYDSNRMPQTKASASPASSAYRYCSSSNVSASNLMHTYPYQHLQHHLVKTVNGVAVMAYPSSYVMGAPAIVHVKDTANSEQESMMAELGFFHPSMASGAYTPPPTPLAPIQCDFNTSVESIRKT